MDSRIDRYLRTIAGKRGHIDPVDAALFKDFLLHQLNDQGIGQQTIINRMRYLGSFLRDSPGPVSGLNEGSVKAIFAAWRKRYKPTTFNNMVRTTRTFLAWTGMDDMKLRVKAQRGGKMTKTAAMMLSGDEVERMIAAAWTSRNRAIISLMYESGMRPVELVRLTWGEVKFDDDGAIINTSEKTGFPRYIRIIAAAPALAAWQADYPDTIRPSAPVFLKARTWRGARFSPITTTTIVRIVEEVAKRAGVEKHVNPYLFRHSRITHLLEAQVPESVIKLTHWGSLSTNMLATYGHVSNQYIDQVLREHAGVAPVDPKEKRDIFKPVQCPGCQTINPPGANLCYICGLPITDKGKATRRMLAQSVLEHPEELIKLLEERKKKVS